MEGESPLLKDGALPLQASLTHRELPRQTPPFTKRKFVSLFVMAGSGGEVFVVLGGAVLLQSAASRGGSRRRAFGLLSVMWVPRSRLRAPLRGSTERRRRFLRDDTVGSRTAEYVLKAVKVAFVIHTHHALRSAEIPPAGAPSGFDSAAGRAVWFALPSVMPLRSG